MPIPKFKDVKTCMASDIMNKEYPDEKQRYAVCQNQVKKYELETYNIEGQEIFKVGKWNNDVYTHEDFERTVKEFEKTKNVDKVPFKLGHDNKNLGELFYSDKEPAIGWVTGLKKVGDGLRANFSKIPKLINDLMNSKAYGRISPEFQWIKDGKNYIKKLVGVALLGGRLPACNTIEDFIGKFYAVDIDSFEESEIDNVVKMEGVKTYENATYQTLDKEREMAEEKGLQEKVKVYEAKQKELEDQLKALKEENEKKDEDLKRYEKENFQKDLEAFFKENEKKMTPHEAKLYKHLAMRDKFDVRTYEDKEYQTNFDVIKEAIKGKEDLDIFEEQTVTEDVTDKKYQSQTDDPEWYKQEMEILKYANMKNITPEEAIDEMYKDGNL